MTEIEYQATLEDYFNDGMERGRNEGREEGREEGVIIGVKKTAISMKAEGIPIETIVRLTGLPEETILGL